ncbi:MAG TPA: type II toxin-antitoxin system mRNA interferase toxin, RelE/StbE family [Candidatus Aenigmarchaeota archaeon]|nr:type II toxin-antitoxin system mRNA interferase toxin, RelE/StbE family [Candidatus Aenigmarchaeota archaeon]
MDYKIEITEPAERKLKKRFDKELQRRFFNKIDKLKIAPTIYGKPLRGPLAGKWELKFERRWRIIYVIDENEKVIYIESILHKNEFT